MSKNASEVTENAGRALKMVSSNKAVWKIVTEGVPPFFTLRICSEEFRDQ